MVNYTKASIYKICCNDLQIKEIYIGSTCNFTQRKYEHKRVCNNELLKTPCVNSKLYKFIRENGGWDNWEMIELKKYPECKDRKELSKYEREWYEELNATLNKQVPSRTKKEYNKEFRKTYNWTKKFPEKYKERNVKKYLCESCEEELSCSNKTRHEKSQRHKYNLTNKIKKTSERYKSK